MTTAPILEVRGLSARYGEVVALRDAELTMREGEFVAVLGPNGAGKTTCFNLISGRFPITSGQIELNGARIDNLPPHRINQIYLDPLLAEQAASRPNVRYLNRTRVYGFTQTVLHSPRPSRRRRRRHSC